MTVSAATGRFVRERAQRRCEYCHTDGRWQCVRFTTDHVRPLSAGGSDDADNLALACRNRNERRGNRLDGRDPESRVSVPISCGLIQLSNTRRSLCVVERSAGMRPMARIRRWNSSGGTYCPAVAPASREMFSSISVPL